MRWRKLGRIYSPLGERPWAASHAYLPTAIVLDDERIRVFVAFVDHGQVGRVGYVDVSAHDPLDVLEVSEHPVLDVGEPGMFDDNGVSPLSVCEHKGRLRLYYAGWQLGVHVRYFLFVGLAESQDGGRSFRRHARTPVLERSDSEPMFRTGAHVRRGEAAWRTWYAGGDRWVTVEGKSMPSYVLRYAESPDGVSWPGKGEVCLELEGEDEIGFGRPSVVEDGGTLRMWYSLRTRSKGYRIGYAESDDGRSWRRHDDRAGIDVSTTGWDSEMVCFPCIVGTPAGLLMFYNGNDYGATGFGVAVADGA